MANEQRPVIGFARIHFLQPTVESHYLLTPEIDIIRHKCTFFSLIEPKRFSHTLSFDISLVKVNISLLYDANSTSSISNSDFSCSVCSSRFSRSDIILLWFCCSVLVCYDKKKTYKIIAHAQLNSFIWSTHLTFSICIARCFRRGRMRQYLRQNNGFACDAISIFGQFL